MQPISLPQLLDPDRVLDNQRGDVTVDHESRAQLLDEALHETCAYAQQLWRDLDAVRAYLLDSLPPDPRTPDPHLSASASPTGPDDDTGWEDWINAYAAVTSVLCGPHGDSGYGLGEARREATLRRNAPVLRIQAAHPDLGTQPRNDPSPTSEQKPQKQSPVDGRSRLARTTATVLLILLALRGLRPRPARPPSTGF